MIGDVRVSTVIFFALVAFSCASVSSTKPKLIVRDDLKDDQYCGIDPDQPSTYHHIPDIDDDDVELIQVQAFIRHGDRMFWGNAPDWCWPGQEHTEYHCEMTHYSLPGTSQTQTTVSEPSIFRKKYTPHRNDYKGNCRVGQLSLKGHRQEVINGDTFRRAYVPRLLSETFTQSEVHFRSDDEPRTLLSAESFVQGLYPIKSRPDHAQTIIDLYTMDIQRDDMSANAHVCPGYDENVAEALASDAYKKFDAASAKLYAEVEATLGIKISDDKYKGSRAFDCIFASACRGTEMPSGVTKELMAALGVDQTFRFYYPIQYPNLARGTQLSGGPLVRELHERQLAAQSAVFQHIPKFFLYSGHDTGPIMTMLSAFNAHEPKWVSYASFISVELWRSSKNASRYFVRAIFNGKVLHLPGCPSDKQLCSFEKFSELITPMIPTREECPDLFRR